MNQHDKNRYRIVIAGLGGVGGYLGTKLVNRYSEDDSYEIVFFQRGEHLQQIRRNGLKYITKNNEHIAVPSIATDNPRTLGPIDLAILCVKSYDLKSCTKMLKKNLGEKSVVISALNGVNNGAMLKRILPDSSILDGCIYISAAILKPGIIKQTGGVGQFIFGPEDGNIKPFEKIETILKNAGIKAELNPNISTHLWEKYIFVCSLATLTSLHKESIGSIVASEKKRNTWINLMEEIIYIAQAQNIPISDSIIDSCIKRAQTIPYNTKTSMQIDVESGRKTEIDIFTQYIVKSANKLDVHVPCHEKAYYKLKVKC